MAITYDPAKNERKIRERGLWFERVADFDFSTAVFHTEIRKGEIRLIAVGYLDGRLHLLCFVPKSRRHSRHQFSEDQREGGKTLWQSANH